MIIAEFNEKLIWIESLALTMEKKINPAAMAAVNPYEIHKEHEKRVMESKRCWVLLQVGRTVVEIYIIRHFNPIRQLHTLNMQSDIPNITLHYIPNTQ